MHVHIRQDWWPTYNFVALLNTLSYYGDNIVATMDFLSCVQLVFSCCLQYYSHNFMLQLKVTS